MLYSNREKEELAFHLDDIINEMDSLIKIFKNETLDDKEFENVYQMIVIHGLYHMKELRKILKTGKSYRIRNFYFRTKALK